MIRVFVSSVSRSLAPTRQQIIAHLRTAGYEVGSMESFGAQADPPLEVCLRELRRSDVVVLIVGPRYGSVLPQGISYTQAEFREARSLGIPVLAFHIPDAPDITAEEKDKLAAFLTEVGSMATYKALKRGESLEVLSAEIQASLTGARDRGELGSRYSPFQPFDRFFSRQIGAKVPLFNHEGPFVGREAELGQAEAFIASRDPVLLLKAPGGSGKTRLLLELAKRTSSPQLLFVDIGASWTADDIRRLPVTPLVLIVDDAHRRADLDRLILACLQHNPEARFIVSCRPSAVSVVTPHIASIATSAGVPEIVLAPLSAEHAESLARHHLGQEMEHLAPRLVKIADRNPLVVSVGGRCVADRRIPPEVLEREPEAFRSMVLDRLLDDPGLKQADASIRRRLLEVVAAVGPVVVESDQFIETTSSLLTTPSHEVRRVLASLEKVGFLLRRGRLVRVSPDVLADHLLYRAAVDEAGRPTGFVEAMVQAFSPSHLASILANAAELDWRAAAAATHQSVLATTWSDIFRTLPGATHSQRATLLDQLEQAAMFAPEEVLRIAEWIDNNREAPPDEHLRAWGLEDSFDRVVDRLADILAFIATHPHFTLRCARRLWGFAASDARPTNLNPSHSQRRLENLLKYEWNGDWRSSTGVHSQIVGLFVEKLREPATTDDRSWAVTLLGTALHRLGEANEANRRSFTIGQFSLARFLPHIAERRNVVIECLRDLALTSTVTEAAAALQELSSLFAPPRGPFGKDLDPDEMAAWQPEAQRAIGVSIEVARSATSEVIRFLARRALREASRQHWPEIAPALDNALTLAPLSPNEDLYDLLIGVPWGEQLDDHEAEERRIGELCEAAALVFWKQHQSAQNVVTTVLDADAAIRTVADRGDSHGGRLVRALVTSKPEEGDAFVDALVAAGESGWRYLRPALLAIYGLDPVSAVRKVESLIKSGSDLLRAYAADPLQWMSGTDPTADAVLALAEQLSRDESPIVKRVVPRVLRRLRETHQAKALRILSSIEWAEDVSVATAVLDTLHPKYGFDPNLLDDHDIDQLLGQIQGLATLEGRGYDILEFVSFASTRRPVSTLEMLLRRVQAVDDHSAERGDERWTPLPYNGHGLSLPGLAASPDYHDLLRQVRDAYSGASVMVRYWLPTLFHSAATRVSTALDVLREWMQSGEAEEIVGAAHLLSGFDHSIVFSIDDFIADLLDAASRVSQECLEHTQSKLYGTAISGAHSGAPGEPAPRHVSDKASAQARVAKYAARPAVSGFYDMLVRHAESSIERDMLRWEEEGDD